MNSHPLHIVTTACDTEDGSLQLELQMRRRRHRVYFKSEDIPLTPSREAFLTLTLFAAMREGLTVPADGPVSRRLLDATERIMELVRSWDPSLHRVAIRGAVPTEKKPAGEDRVGVFFSAGVDSFHTLLTHRDEITDLLFVHGFDVELGDHASRSRASKIVRAVGTSLGKNVIEIETNLRSFVRPYVSYTRLGHGAALASIGHLLAPLFRRIYIASSYTDDVLFPWGSHPELDPLWSTETLQFVHDGCDVTRVEKVARLAESDLALQSLRVCLGGRSNCGRCEKCVRTMINLVAVGAMDRCRSFDVPLDLRNVRKILVEDIHTGAFVTENLRALEQSGRDPQLYEALKEVMHRPLWRTKMLKFGRKLRRKAGKWLPRRREKQLRSV